MRTISGLYLLAKAAAYASLQSVPFEVTPSDLMDFNSHTFLLEKKTTIDTQLIDAASVSNVLLLLAVVGCHQFRITRAQFLLVALNSNW